MTVDLINLLKARRDRGSRAPHGDEARIALAIEGGAMRGVISAGMVAALEELGLTHAFDAVYGSSGGAINGAYFLAGQARLGSRIYSEDINNRHFIDLWRPLRGRPIVDLGFLLDDVARRRKPLDTDLVLASASPLVVIATDVAAATRAALRHFSSADDLFTALRAGATMPVIAGPPVSFAGRQYLDASITEPIPVPLAEAEGFTHILALLTRPPGTVHRRLTARPVLCGAAPAPPLAGPGGAVRRARAGRTRPCSTALRPAAARWAGRMYWDCGRRGPRSANWSAGRITCARPPGTDSMW